MQTQSDGHIGRGRFGEKYVREMQYMKHHRVGKGPLEEEEGEWHHGQASVGLGDDETRRGGGLGVFFAFAPASVLVLLGCRGSGRRWRRRLRLLDGWGLGGRGSWGR
jgi:hypothetical protein